MRKDYKLKEDKPSVLKKKKEVQEIANMLRRHKGLIIIDLRNTPDRLLQKIKKRIREEFGGETKVAKKTVVMRSVVDAGKPKELVENIDFPAGIIAIDESPYRVAVFFKQNTLEMPAKVGQVAPYDIVVPEGETDLPAGPALSELKSAGLNVKIDKGKIVVAKDSIVAKQGEVLTPIKVKALQTLGIKPFRAGVVYYIGYDGETIFRKEDVSIMPEEIAAEIEKELKNSFNLSVNAVYPTKQNIELLLRDAFSQARNVSINGLIYSDASIEQLLLFALRQAGALEGIKKEGGS
ncbi:MAG: 50S ribosomal protein L10 [Candidatus Anstonellales archaeon]